MKFPISDRARAEFAFYRDTPLDMIGHDLPEQASEKRAQKSEL